MLYAIMFHLGVGFILALIFYRLLQTAWFEDVSGDKEAAALWCWFIVFLWEGTIPILIMVTIMVKLCSFLAEYDEKHNRTFSEMVFDFPSRLFRTRIRIK